MKRLAFPARDHPTWYHVLLVVLIMSMWMRPLLRAVESGETWLIGVNVLVLLACVLAMGRAPIGRIVAWVALLPAALLTTVFRGRHDEPHMIGQALGALVMLLVCGRILHRIFTTRNVSWATISGAIAVFLLLSSMWTMLYTMAAWSPGLEPAFNGIPPASELLASTELDRVRTEVDSLLRYFSLVTLTTLGYGDVSPAHPITRALATSEAVIGQLYLVVLVARLVSMQMQGPNEEQGEEPS